MKGGHGLRIVGLKRVRTMLSGVGYDWDGLSSLKILRRGLRLCGLPFAMSVDAS